MTLKYHREIYHGPYRYWQIFYLPYDICLTKQKPVSMLEIIDTQWSVGKVYGVFQGDQSFVQKVFMAYDPLRNDPVVSVEKFIRHIVEVGWFEYKKERLKMNLAPAESVNQYTGDRKVDLQEYIKQYYEKFVDPSIATYSAKQNGVIWSQPIPINDTQKEGNHIRSEMSNMMDNAYHWALKQAGFLDSTVRIVDSTEYAQIIAHSKRI